MACRKEGLKNDVRSSNAATLSAAASDALLFATICIIGLPVEVHIKDGSVYSGIFHTASVDYAIVLKKARLIKKGSKQANVQSGDLIETLIVNPQDFVQVIAKEILLGANDSTEVEGGKGIEAIAGRKECNVEANATQFEMSGGNTEDRSRTSISIKRENSYPHSSVAKAENIFDSSVEEQSERSYKTHDAVSIDRSDRSYENGLQDIKIDSRNDLELQDNNMDQENQGSCQTTSSTAFSEKTKTEGLPKEMSCSVDHVDEGQSLKGSVPDGICTAASNPNNSVTSIPSVDFNSESRLSASSAAFVPAVSLKTSNAKRTTKASKLNPGAKIFSPAMLHNKSVVPNTVSIGAGLPGITDSYNMAVTTTTQEVDAESFVDSSIPVKFSPYNVTIGNGNNDASYIQPIVGQVINRSQPIRYASQFQSGPCHLHSYPQNVMLGRAGPVVCVHPIPNDIVQTGTGLSQATPWSLLNPHPVHLPKHQGNASAQAIPLCMSTPAVMANGPQQFLIPNTIPISQPLFPGLHTVAIPRSNSYFSPKFA